MNHTTKRDRAIERIIRELTRDTAELESNIAKERAGIEEVEAEGSIAFYGDLDELTTDLAEIKAEAADRLVSVLTCERCGSTPAGMMAPNHFASHMCKSSKRNHCTCDTCF